MRVGRSPGIWQARLGRLSLELHPARTADLAAASPAPNSLECGLRRARAGRFTDGVPEQDAEFAFRFGVALHDVVAVAG